MAGMHMQSQAEEGYLNPGDVQCKMAGMNPVQCLCGGTAVLLIQNDREVAVTVWDRTARLLVCQSCGYVFFWPLPTDTELADYYNGPWNAGSTHRIEDSF